MKKLKRLANSNDLNIVCHSPFPNEVTNERHSLYNVLSDEAMQKGYRHYLFVPAILEIADKHYEIQLNHCTNPFCEWYAQPQQKFEALKSKPSRYKLGSQTKGEYPRLFCNNIPLGMTYRKPLEHTSETVSNWSVAEEIKRLITINAVTEIVPDYQFHKEGCSKHSITPFQDKKLFVKRGKSSSNSPKYQCKECKKITNILPRQDESFNYHQGRNDVLVEFAKDLLSKVPVRRTCEKLGIASSTYYSKLELLYKRCLEFLEVHENKPLGKTNLPEVWLNTDSMIYYLNNIRAKGKGGKGKIGVKEPRIPTHLLASGDLRSGYVFRSDISYDFDISLDDVERDTKVYHCDHSYPFLRKNERLKYPFCPQAPTSLDSQSMYR